MKRIIQTAWAVLIENRERLVMSAVSFVPELYCYEEDASNRAVQMSRSCPTEVYTAVPVEIRTLNPRKEAKRMADEKKKPAPKKPSKKTTKSKTK